MYYCHILAFNILWHMQCIFFSKPEITESGKEGSKEAKRNTYGGIIEWETWVGTTVPTDNVRKDPGKPGGGGAGL